MNTSYSAAYQEAATLADSNIVILNTIIISHPSAGAINLVKDREDLKASLETGGLPVTFRKSNFEMGLPKSSPKGTQYMNVTIPNIDREGSDYINQIPLDTDIETTVTYRTYLAGQDETATPENDPPLVLFVTDVQVDLVKISFRASFQSLINKKYPVKLYTADDFPALHT